MMSIQKKKKMDEGEIHAIVDENDMKKKMNEKAIVDKNDIISCTGSQL